MQVAYAWRFLSETKLVFPPVIGYRLTLQRKSAYLSELLLLWRSSGSGCIRRYVLPELVTFCNRMLYDLVRNSKNSLQGFKKICIFRVRSSSTELLHLDPVQVILMDHVDWLEQPDIDTLCAALKDQVKVWYMLSCTWNPPCDIHVRYLMERSAWWNGLWWCWITVCVCLSV